MVLIKHLAVMQESFPLKAVLHKFVQEQQSAHSHFLVLFSVFLFFAVFVTCGIVSSLPIL